MNDFRDLKAIAEVCQQHQPLRFMRSHGALYIRNDNGIVFDVHQNRSFPEFMAQNKDYADLVLAASPATVLALIGENERVKARLCVCRDCGGQGEVYSGHSSYQGNNEPPEPDMDVCGTCGGDGVLGPLEDFEALAAERDQLKAENEALRKYGEEFAVLAERRREEVETLRKERDARHPFKPFHEPAIGFTGCVIFGVYTDHGGLPCPKTRATADAAMGKGEQS
ncbi:hypothetical protein HX819_28220 [Pseudomonas sp. D6002]|uniref:hypothetical protein n=1 Tax=unclassified Pseudomonas TaxID=196821 RepID=UPI0015A3059F|nr:MULTISPECIES: hypothetical protein [unclassified Pseudomonas]NVZ95204.1 hypothetical protein [Pseudomonas sp. B6001]NWB18337.1 hypothetical protein [Pseudomonas sp. D6002]NWB62350.1 hypothetical protein [Pseudomonas sp. F1002]NWC06825.1 hypothetical protein [Pseudomonas sp. G1002]